MKKKIIFLWPWNFKKSDWYRYEIDKLNSFKGSSLEVHQLANIISFKRQIKNNLKKNKSIKIFDNLNTWIKKIKNLSKKEKIFIINEIKPFNYATFKVRKILKSLQKNNQIYLIEYYGNECPAPEKQGLKFIKEIFFQLLFNPYLFFSSLRTKFFNLLDSKIKLYPNYLLLTNNQKPLNNLVSKKIKVSSLDFSNYLVTKNLRATKKKYGIYIDSPLPGSSDNNFFYYNFPFKSENWFKSLNLFFLKIENVFNLKILIAPHPKNNLNYLKKIYKNRKILKGPISQYSKSADLFISRNSTALSFPVIHKKPIFLVYSDDQKKISNYIDVLHYKAFSKELNIKPINIDREYTTSFIKKSFKIDKSSFITYEKKFLTSKNLTEPNYKVIKKFIFLNN